MVHDLLAFLKKNKRRLAIYLAKRGTQEHLMQLNHYMKCVNQAPRIRKAQICESAAFSNPDRRFLSIKVMKDNDMQIQPKVAIVILNWNGWEDTLGCLESLDKVDYINYCVIVVDNGSTDKSIAKIKEYAQSMHLPLADNRIRIQEDAQKEEKAESGHEGEIESAHLKYKLILIENGENRGFAGGNNSGIDYAITALDPKYVLLLNNDTMVDRLFLEELVKAIGTDGKIGSVQSLLLRPGGNIVDSLGQEMLWTRVGDMGWSAKLAEIALDGKVEIFGPCAAAALYRAEALKEVGFFDDSFFIMGEDVDLSWRLRLKGYSSFLVPSSIVYHRRGISGGRLNDAVLIGKYFGNRNWLLIVLRYYPLSVFSKAPKRLLSVFMRCIFSATKLGKVLEVCRLFFQSLIIRRAIARDPNLAKVQSQWIKDQESAW